MTNFKHRHVNEIGISNVIESSVASANRKLSIISYFPGDNIKSASATTSTCITVTLEERISSAATIAFVLVEVLTQ